MQQWWSSLRVRGQTPLPAGEGFIHAKTCIVAPRCASACRPFLCCVAASVRLLSISSAAFCGDLLRNFLGVFPSSLGARETRHPGCMGHTWSGPSQLSRRLDCGLDPKTPISRIYLGGYAAKPHTRGVGLLRRKGSPARPTLWLKSAGLLPTKTPPPRTL